MNYCITLASSVPQPQTKRRCAGVFWCCEHWLCSQLPDSNQAQGHLNLLRPICGLHELLHHAGSASNVLLREVAHPQPA